MASGAQVSEEAGGFGAQFEVAFSNQATWEPGEVSAGGEIVVASANQLAEWTEGVGGLTGVSPTNQVTGEAGTVGGETGAGHADQVIEQAGGIDGKIGVVQVIGVGGLNGEVLVASGDEITREPGGVGGEIGPAPVDQIILEPELMAGEIGVSSADQIIQDPEGLGAEIEPASVNHLKVEAGASDGEIWATSVNHESEEAGSLGGDIKVVSLNHVTEEARGSDVEIETVSASPVNGDPADVGGEIGVASADELIEPGGRSGKIGVASVDEVNEPVDRSSRLEVASANEVNGEPPGGRGSEVGVASDIQVNGKPEGQIGGIEFASAYHVNEEPGGRSGKIGVASVDEVNEPVDRSSRLEVASANEVNGEPPGGRGSEVGVASDIQVNGKPEGQIGGIEFASAYHVNEEPGGAGGENSVASANQVNAEQGGAGGEKPPGGKGDKFGVVSEIQVNGEPGSRSTEILPASANQMNEEPGGDIGLVSANQVNGEPGASIRLASANQVNAELGGNIGLASANQVNGEPGGGDGEIRVASSNQVNGVSRTVGGELGVGEKHRWVDTKVYRRRPKGEKNKGALSNLTAAPATKTLICNGNGSRNDKLTEVNTHQNNQNRNIDRVDGNGVVESEIIVSDPALSNNANLNQIQPETVGEVISNKELISARMDSATPISVDPPVTNGALRPSDSASDSKVRINLASTAEVELRELKRKFENELYSVRKAVKRMDCGREEVVVSEFFHPVINSSVLLNGARSNGFATRVYSGTRSLGHVPYKPNIRPFNQLRVSVVDNGLCIIDSIEREKRTPKANQFYRNSEFLLANDKFPPAESNKKSKSNGKKSSGAEFGFGVGSKVYKSCSALLEKLMKHKHGWVFNAPVDVKGLGLHDYCLIIKNPMDLGTVKAKLIKFWYKSPMEFAEDVRLTFHNAMLYNPKGHDVHIMAETLLKIFEGKWPDIEVKYLRELRMAVEPDMGYPTPTSRINNQFQSSAFPHLETRVYNRSESMPHPVNPKPRTLTPTPSFRAPALKKPKAKDLNKRDMTYDEKRKLSTHLQSLPPEKLDGVIQIIKKRSTALSQNDDEIEVDIDTVDTETLWELDRFVTNYKKSLSKNRRKAELANQMRAEARQAAEKNVIPQPLPPRESTAGYGNATLTLPPHQNDPAANASGSSSSSSSSSSGSSSSDSDSDSSSEESGGRSPGT